MPKHAVLSLTPDDLVKPIDFKKNILLFDDIYFEEISFLVSENLIQAFSKNERENYNFNKSEINFLAEKELIKFEKFYHNEPPLKVYPSGTREISTEAALSATLKLLASPEAAKQLIKDDLSNKRFRGLAKQGLHFAFRKICGQLSEKGLDVFPLFNEEPDFEVGKKTKVMKFVLTKLPVPSNTTPWEVILDFKNDPNTIMKYFALINWINEVSKTESTIHEIVDKYNYLYSDYVEQYRIHKMKHTYTTLEIIVNIAGNLLSGKMPLKNIQESFFSAKRNELNLLEQESKFSGREVAYIAKARRDFQ